MRSAPFFFLISLALPNLVWPSEEDSDPYLRGLWNRAKDIAPVKYDVDLLREEWDNMEETVRGLSYKLLEEGTKQMASAFGKSKIGMPPLSKKCSKNLFDLLIGFVRLEPWAHLMLFSSSIVPSEVMGKTLFLGSYDMCISLNAKNDRIRGKYCKLETTLPFPKTGAYIARPKNDPLLLNFTSPDSLANILIKTVAPYFYFTYAVMAVCVPSSCSGADVKAMADKVVEFTGINFEVRLIGCQMKETFEFNAYDVVSMCIVLSAFLMCVSGTVVDLYLQRKRKSSSSCDTKSGGLPRVLACFSIRQGTTLLLRDEESTTVKVFGGIQVLTMLWLVICYAHWYIPLNAYGAATGLQEPYVPFNFEFVRNGFLALDTFLFIWAALLMESRMKETGEDTSIFQYLLRKIMSVAPPVTLITAVAILSKNLGAGPIWKETIYPLSRRCERNWWQNVLFINNFVSCSDQCLSWLWLMATDLQLYVVALLVIFYIRKKPTIGLSMIGMLFATGVLASVANHIIYDLPPTVILSAIYLPDDIMYYLDNGLFPSYLHMTTYAIGLAVGYILNMQTEFRISGRINTVVYLSMIPLGLALICSVHPWNTGAPPPNLAISTLYSVLTKILWALALAWVTVSCMKRGTGIISSFLSWKMFTILGRLTCTVYLVHPLVIYLYIGNLRQVIQADGTTLILLYISLVMVSYIMAYILYIFSQSPYVAIEQMFSNSPTNNKEKELPTVQPQKKEKNLLFQNNIAKC